MLNFVGLRQFYSENESTFLKIIQFRNEYLFKSNKEQQMECGIDHNT